MRMIKLFRRKKKEEQKPKVSNVMWTVDMMNVAPPKTWWDLYQFHVWTSARK